MGNIKKHRKKYQSPSHPWQATRMKEETEIRREFGIRRKKEIWKLRSKIRTWMRQAKALVSQRTEQAEREKKQLLDKLTSLSLIPEQAKLNDVLDISLSALFQRRLQSIVVKKNLARTMKQARQFITHKHIQVNGVAVTKPSYLVHQNEEASISFTSNSALTSEDHPERVQKNGSE